MRHHAGLTEKPTYQKPLKPILQKKAVFMNMHTVQSEASSQASGSPRLPQCLSLGQAGVRREAPARAFPQAFPSHEQRLIVATLKDSPRVTRQQSPNLLAATGTDVYEDLALFGPGNRSPNVQLPKAEHTSAGAGAVAGAVERG